MLSSIYLKNFAIIDEIEIDFHENMSVLTGETGAGKSILLSKKITPRTSIKAKVDLIISPRIRLLELVFFIKCI